MKLPVYAKKMSCMKKYLLQLIFLNIKLIIKSKCVNIKTGYAR
ncbi:Uncharacterized protein dnl_26570 [Desulfonema limicola]|uniref:Uncharacterized protein n=1 Tax=Desulfonema limicola TaxID=45656 RepID=A0A975B824_9BACT|nr:Uncharacterized protein dnl_26570 [Desulfonema limicola]